MRTTRFSWLLSGLLSLLVWLAATPASAITVQGTLYNNTRWTKTMSPVILAGDVTVNTGVTLTIDPGVVVQAASSDGQAGGADRARVELIVMGTLRAIGSSTDKISFTGASKSKSSWYGIRVMTGGSTVINYATIEYGSTCIDNNNVVDLSDLEIKQCGTYGIYSRRGTTSISKAKLNNNRYGLYVTGGSKVTVQDSDIYRNTSYGVYVTSGDVKLSNCQIYRNSSYGVYASYSSSTTKLAIEFCTIVYNSSYGIYANRGSSSAGAFKLDSTIVAKNAGTGSSGYEVYSANYGISCTNNLIWDSGGGTRYNRYSPSCSTTVFYNPLFVDANKDDYRIYDRSPARFKGTGGGDIGAKAWSTHKTNVLHGYLRADLSLPTGTHTVPGDLIVPKGITLTLAPGAILRFKTTDDMYGGSDNRRTELVVEGKLVAKGTSSQAITLQADSSSNSRSQWYGVRVVSGGTAELDFIKAKSATSFVYNTGSTTLNYSDVSYSDYAVNNRGGSVTVNTCKMYSGRYGLYNAGGKASINASKIYRNSSYGAYITSGDVTLSFTEIYRNSSYGVYASYSSSTTKVTMNHCTVANNSSYGIYVNRGSSSAGAFKLDSTIVVRNAGTGSSGYEVYSANYGLSCTNNLIWDSGGGTRYNRYSPSCSTTVFYNPLFVDPNKDDYRIYDRSPARFRATGGKDIGAQSWTTHKTNVLHGYLRADLTLSAGTHSIPGDFLIPKGVTLTLSPGAVVRFKTSDDMYGGLSNSKPELVIEGKLVAKGTSSQKITFQPDSSSSSRSQWYGVRILSGATAEIEHPIFKGGDACLRNQGGLTLVDPSMSYCRYGLYNQGGTATITRGIFFSNQYGFYLQGGKVVSTEPKIYSQTSYGIYLTSGDLSVSKAQIYRNSSYGVYASYSSSTTKAIIDHSTIAYNSSYGVYVNRGSSSAGAFRLTNSIVVRNAGTGSSGYETYSANYGITCSGNLIWDGGGGTRYNRYSPSCSTVVFYNPLFVNPSSNDFRLYDRSPARKIAANGKDAGALPWTVHKTNVLHGYIFQDLTLSTGTYTMPGDLVIPKGVTLTLEKGAILKVSSGDDMYGGSSNSRSELIVRGNLIAYGGSQANEKVQIIGSGSATSRNQWYGVRIFTGGTADFRQVLIRNAQYGIYNSGVTKSSDIEISYSGSYATYMSGGTLSMVRGRIHRNNYGFYLNSGKSRISFTQVYRNTSYGAYASYSSSTTTIWMDHNTITNNSSYGLYVNRGSSSAGAFELRNSIVVQNAGTGSSGYELYSSNYGVTCVNNLIWDTGGRTVYNRYSPSCRALITSNPLFVNAAQDDYKIQATSPARKKATDGSDLGALQFVAVLAQIIVTPSSATLEVGKSTIFTAQGLDSNGGIISNVSLTWKVVAGGGTINSSGQFTAGTKVGSYVSTVEASSGSVKGYATVVIKPGPVTKVTVSPSSRTVKAGEKISFSFSVFDQYNNAISGKTATWAVTTGAGTIDTSGNLTAGTKAGNYPNAVTATVDGVTGQATVVISPNSLKTLTVSPNPGNVQPNKTLQFSAVGRDTYGNIVPNLSISWKMVSGGGTIDPTGLVTADPNAGTFTNTVQASSGSVKGTATLIVGGGTPKVATVEISPSTANLKFGDKQSFTARAKDQNGKTVSGQTFTWSLVNGGGTFTTSSGLKTRADFTAGNKAGSYQIAAVTGGIKGFATISIKDPNAGVLDRIVVSPAQATVKVGKTQTFTVQGYDKNNKVMAVTPVWSVSGGGSIDAKGEFKAGSTAGTYTVTAKDGNVSGTAKVQVVAGKAPTTPTLSSPKDKAEVTSNQPTLVVKNSTDPDGDKLQYEFEVASDSKFTTIAASGRVPETTSTTPWQVSKALQEDTTYYWRARAFDGTLYSAWTSGWSFRVNAVNSPPTAPKLSSPVDGGQVATLQPTLEVTNATDPEKQKLVYRFEIATDKAMNTVVARSPQVAETSGSTSWKVNTNLKDQTVYYWQAWAIDDKGLQGAKMAVASFTVSLANKAPTAPRPRDPKDGDTAVTLRPTFEVVNSTDPDGDTVTLDIEVDSKKTFDSPGKVSKTGLAQDGSGITSWTIDRDLTENQNYFWRVRASDGKTTTSWIFGGEFTVNSKNDPPTAPTPKAPADKTTESSTSITLEVDNATDPDGDTLTYHFQISEDSSFQGQVDEQQPIKAGATTTTWQPTSLVRGKTYYWRARANDGTNDGPWSTVYSFTIELGEVATETVEEKPVEEATTEVTPDAGEPAPEPQDEPVADAGSGKESEAKDTGTSTDESSTVDEGGQAGGCGCSSNQQGFPLAPIFLAIFGLLLFGFRFRRKVA